MHATTTSYEHKQGMVYKKTIGTYFVHADGQVVPCAISPKLRKILVYPTADPSSLSRIVREVRDVRVVDPVAVGDQVRFVDTHDGSGLIVEVLERKSALVRRESTGPFIREAREQLIVANLDQVVAVFASAQPEPKWGLLDRYLVSAESLGLPILICITKLDLLDKDRELLDAIAGYRKIGYPVILTSAVTGLGLEELQGALRDRLSVFIGKSGVGKTSLLNALQPGLGQRVSQVNQKIGKGKHATTHPEMFPMESGGSVVDTPGMREFGLWEVSDDDLAFFFPEMRSYVGKCRFGLDCSHAHEPGCAIREAVEEGEIAERRYQSYLKLRGG
jgi:ribosome biogenesis GTPase